MSDTDFKVQWSVSLPPAAQYAKGDMLNLRGETVDEVEAIFDEVLAGEFIGKASQVADLLRAAQVVSETPAASQSAPAEAAPSGDGDGASVSNLRVCTHGKMEYKAAFTSRGGKAISASYNCPLGYKNPSSCKTVWED